MNTITVHAPVKVAPPGASRFAATAFNAVVSWFQRHRAARAEQTLQAERAEEAAAVRQYAQRFASHDPRFAADLLAAADRHERTD